jgi:hypothetical protein
MEEEDAEKGRNGEIVWRGNGEINGGRGCIVWKWPIKY